MPLSEERFGFHVVSRTGIQQYQNTPVNVRVLSRLLESQTRNQVRAKKVDQTLATGLLCRFQQKTTIVV